MVPDKMNPLAWPREHLDDEGGNDVVRDMVKAFGAAPTTAGRLGKARPEFGGVAAFRR